MRILRKLWKSQALLMKKSQALLLRKCFYVNPTLPLNKWKVSSSHVYSYFKPLYMLAREIKLKLLSLCRKLRFFNPCIFATHWHRMNSMNSVRSNYLSLKYAWYTPYTPGCKYKEIRKLEFVVKTQFLCGICHLRIWYNDFKWTWIWEILACIKIQLTYSIRDNAMNILPSRLLELSTEK